MASLSSLGYDQLTTFIQNNFDWIALSHSGAGNGTTGEVIRLDPSDARVTWNSALTDDIQEIEIKVAGADADITYPQSFDGIEIYLNDTDTTAVASDTFELFTIQTDTDEYTAKGRFRFV